MTEEPTWEDVASPREGDYTERLKIPGGWLYRVFIYEPGYDTGTPCLAVVFVPDV